MKLFAAVAAVTCLFVSPVLGQDNLKSKIAATLPEGAKLASVAYSSNGEHIAYCVAIEGNHRVYFKGEIIAEHKEISSLAISEDGKSLAYVARIEGKDFVFLGKQKWGPYDQINRNSLVISPRGKNVAYIVDGSIDSLFVNENKLIQADEILPVCRFVRENQIVVLTRAGREIWWKAVSLSGPVSMEEAYETVLGAYYDYAFEAVKKGESFDSNKAWDFAAKKGGFESKRDFDYAVSDWGDAEAAARASKKVSEAYQLKIERLTKERASNALKTPKQIVDEFMASFVGRGKKWESAKPLMTKKAQEFIDMLIKMEESEKDGMSLSSYTILDEKIDGTKAIVTVKAREKKMDGTDKPDKVEIVKLKNEDGSWKIYGIGGTGSNDPDFEDDNLHQQMKEAIKMIEEMRKQR